MEEKQTAVEWFYFEMENLRVKAEITNMDGNDFIIAKVKLLQQAKEMEKENIINFALQCMFGRTDIGSNLKNDFIKKYNETFKSE